MKISTDKSMNFTFYAITLIAAGAIYLNAFLLPIPIQAQNPEKTTFLLGEESGESVVTKEAGETPAPNSVSEKGSNSAPPLIKLRKIFAPESQIRRWPLGGKKYRFINEKTYKSALDLWLNRQVEGANPTDSFSDSGITDAYIESAAYQGSLSPSGELSGTGEWVIRLNPLDAAEQSGKTSGDKNAYQTTLNTPFTHFLVPPTMKMLISDFTFISNNTAQNKESASAGNREDFTWDNLIVGCLPSGQTVIFVPSDGVIHFRWTAARQEANDYLLQTAPSIDTVWKLNIPSDRKLILRNSDSDKSPLRCASIDSQEIQPESSDVKKANVGNAPANYQYTFRWSGTETALVSLTPAKTGIEKSECPYRQQTTYYFSHSQLRTRSKITFIPGLKTVLPKEIPFKAINDSHAIWEASYDGQPVEIRVTDSGYNIVLGKVQPQNKEPVLQISSNVNLETILGDKPELLSANKDSAVQIAVPRIELQTGHWQAGTALFYTPQMPLQFNSGSSNITEAKIDARRRFITTIEMASKEEKIEITLKPFQERFYSQDETTLQWDGSQISFQSRIYLWAEQGSRYVLTAPLPEHLAIDHVEFLEKANMLEDWEVQTDANNPLKRTLIIYLRESIRSDRSFSLEVHSHTITAWDSNVFLETLQPIRFDGFEPHSQTLMVQVPLNQRFWVADRIIYSPAQNKEAPFSETISESEHIILPRGIEMTPLLSKEGFLDSRAIIGAEFRIDLQKWGKSMAKLEPEDNGFSLDANITLITEENHINENVALYFKGDCSRLSQFRFSFDSRLDDSNIENSETRENDISPWKCTLETPVNRYVLEIIKTDNNVYCVNLPTSVSSPFSLRLERKILWNQTYSTELFQPEGCRQMSAKVNIYSSIPKMLDIQADNLHPLISRDMEFINKIIRQYAYSLKPESDKQNATDNKSAKLVIKRRSDDLDAHTIWAWNERVEEYHFGCGNVQTSAQWTIENRFPPVSSKRNSEHVRQYIHLMLPETLDDSETGLKSSSSLTGLWFDGVLIGGENIRIESDGSYSILLPIRKKLFTMTVQWTNKQPALKTANSFTPQQPQLDIPVFQSRWNVYYPTSYRRWNSFASSDASVDGFLQRWFGPLVRRKSDSLYGLFNRLWEASQIVNIGKPSTGNSGVGETSPELSNAAKATITAASTQCSSIDHLDNSLSSRESWNCCAIVGKSRINSICIVRNDVCECFRWTIFICTVCLIFSFYKKRIQANESPSGISLNRRPGVNSASENGLKESGVIPVSNSASGQSVIRDNSLERSGNSRQPRSSSTVERISTSELSAPKRFGMRVKSWGFRRWLAIICIGSALLAQVLPWSASLLFSGLFSGTLLGLLVLVRSNGSGKSESSSYAYPLSVSQRSSLFSVTGKSASLYVLIFSIICMFFSSSFAQQPRADYSYDFLDDYQNYSSENNPFSFEPNASAASSGKAPVSPVQSITAPEYQVFIPLDERGASTNMYYIPQELYETLQNVGKRTQYYPWAICRANYYGKLVQQLYKTETSAWRVVLEIETFFPNVSVQLPQRMKETTYASSNITIRRGLPSYFPGVKEEEKTGKNSNSHSADSNANSDKPAGEKKPENTKQPSLKTPQSEIRWIWDAPRKIAPQWNAQDERWILKITQPGRYIIETVFHPTIKSAGGKNEISFAVLPCLNSTLELELPGNISDLEFPGALGIPQDLVQDVAADSLSATMDNRQKVKFVPLGSIDQVVVRWNQGGILSGEPTYDVDTLSWWTVAPEKASLKVKFRIKVSSGEVSSLKIKTDPRLILPVSGQESSEESSSESRSAAELENVNDSASADMEPSDNPANSLSRSGVGAVQRRSAAVVAPPSSLLANKIISNPIATTKNGIQSFDSQSPISAIVQNLERRNEYTVLFKSPIRDQVFFEMDFVWENAIGVGAPQFPTVIVQDGHGGRRLAAFSLDSRLQCDWNPVSTSAAPIPVQTFVDLWGASARQSAESISRGSETTIIPLPPPPGADTMPIPIDPASALEGTGIGSELENNPLLNPGLAKGANPASQNLPAAAFDMNQAKNKTETADSSDCLSLNIQRIPPSAKGAVEVFLLAVKNKIRWQILWNLESVKGERSKCTILLPEMPEEESRNWIIQSASVKTEKQSCYASVYKHGNTVDVYWGVPISQPCQVVLTGEIQLTDTTKDASSEWQNITRFVFPTIDTVEINQYKLALARGDEVNAELKFENPASTQTVFSPLELPMESPFAGRCQRVVGTWQTAPSVAPCVPVDFYIYSKENIVKAKINYSMTVSLENPPEITLLGNIQSVNGILDEIVFEMPNFFGVPVSQRATITCTPDLNSISPNRYILRSASPFTAGNSFQLTIPLIAGELEEWLISGIQFENITVEETLVQLPVMRKDAPIQWHLERLIPVNGVVTSEPARTAGSVVKTGVSESSVGKSDSPAAPVKPEVKSYKAPKNQFLATGYISSAAEKWTQCFGISIYIKPVSEFRYYAAAEFSAAVLGSAAITVEMPENSEIVDIQVSQKSVNWQMGENRTVTIPLFSEKEPENIRIVYRGNLSRSLYSEPMAFYPPRVLNSRFAGPIAWIISPWKNFNKIASPQAHPISNVLYQTWKMDDLLEQMRFVQSLKGNVSEVSIERFKSKFHLIEQVILQSDMENQSTAVSSDGRTASREESGSPTPSHQKSQTQWKRQWQKQCVDYLAMISALSKYKTPDDSYTNEVRQNSPSDSSTGAIKPAISDFSLVVDSSSSAALIIKCENIAPITLELNLQPNVHFSYPLVWLGVFVLLALYLWLAFFPPELFLPWRTTLVFGSLGVVWLIWFNLYPVALLLLVITGIGILKRVRRLTRREIVPLRVR